MKYGHEQTRLMKYWNLARLNHWFFPTVGEPDFQRVVIRDMKIFEKQLRMTPPELCLSNLWMSQNS